MNIYYQSANNILSNISNSKKRIISTVINKNEVDKANTEFIRFEEKKERYIWAHPNEICFVISADHYVKSLIKCGNQKKWMIRHSTLKELFDILPADNFIRLNKFYLINQNYFSRVNESEKILYLNDNFPIPVPHRISPYVLHLLNNTCT